VTIIDHENHLGVGSSRPTSFSLSDIDVHLPCEEDDFVFGQQPAERAVLPGTAAALAYPHLENTPSRSLFAVTIQAVHLWGRVAHFACHDEHLHKSSAPWEPGNEYAEIAATLSRWEARLAPRHRWSKENLRRYQARNLDLVTEPG
jgi:hypothetical protein